MSDRPRILWIKSRMPTAVPDGSSLVSLNFARCLSEWFDLDLITQELTGRERTLSQAICPPFCGVTIVKPDNAGSFLRRLSCRIGYGVKACVLRVPRGALHEVGPRMRSAVRAALVAKSHDLVVFEYWTLGRLLGLAKPRPAVLFLHDTTEVWLTEHARRQPHAWRRWKMQRTARAVGRFEVQVATEADHVYCLSEADAAAFRDLGVPEARYLPVPMPPLPQEGPCLASHTVLFVGGLGHAPNIDGIAWIVREVWPDVIRRVPDAILKIVGGPVTDAVRRALAGPSVEVAGRVGDLSEIYREAAVAIAPSRFGTGVKTKVLEYIWAGLPVVATSAAVPGTPGEHGGALVANRAHDFAASLVELLVDVTRRLELRERAWTLLDRDHSSAAAHHRLANLFKSTLGDTGVE